MHIRVGLCIAFSVVVAGCATVSRGPDTVTLSGKVTDRNDIAAAPKWSVNEDYTRAMTGAVGVLISQLRGTPKHYVYTVKSIDGNEYSVPAKTEVAVGTCLEIFVPKEKTAQRAWQLDEVGVEASERCK